MGAGTGGLRGWMWAALLATALGARILGAMANPVIERDGVTFLAIAREAREVDPGALLRQDQHPLYPALEALAYPLFGDWQLAGLSISILAGTLTVIPVVLLGDRAVGPPAGLLGGWMFAVARYPVHYGSSAISDATHGLLFAASAWAGAVSLGLGKRGKEAGAAAGFGPCWSFLLTGLLAGAAYMTRPEGLAIAAALFLAAFLKLLAALDGKALRSFLLGSALLGIGLAATGGPYAALLSEEHGSFRLTRKKPIIEALTTTGDLGAGAAPGAPGASPKVEEAPAAGAAAPPPAVAPGKAHPLSSLPPRLAGVLLALRDFAECLGWIPVGLFVLGVLHRRRSRAPILAEIYLLVPLLEFVVVLSGVYILMGEVGRRHLYPPTLIAEGLVGAGFIAAGGALARLRPGAPAFLRSPQALAAIAALAILPKSIGLIPESGRDKDLWLREIGLSLRVNIAPPDRVLCSSPLIRIGFYSGGRVLRKPTEPAGPDELSRLCAEATARKARWLIVDRSAGDLPAGPPGGWTLARRIPHEGGEVRLYRGPE